jgi:phosphoglycolate phosphatase-like HAD superfamily hydrolase
MISMDRSFFLDRTLVFDFDGVLADSVEVKTQAFAELYRSCGDDVVQSIMSHHRAHGGMSRFEKFVHYHKNFLGQSLLYEEVQQLSTAFSSLVVEKVIAAPEIEGAVSFLAWCQQKGIDCTVNSATPELEIREIVDRRGWSEFFSCVFGSPSSKSENLKRIIEERGVSARELVFFGDASSDLQAALENRVEFIGIGPWMLEHHSSDNHFPVYRSFTELTDEK